jgi:type IV pilus assembly protein PilX
MSHIRPSFRSQAHQYGGALITSLIMLIAVTMLMLSVMRNNNVEERMAGNARDWNLAFQAAEAALRDAERLILPGAKFTGMTGFAEGCSEETVNGTEIIPAGLCLVSTNGTPIWVALANNQDPGWTSGQDTGKSIQYGKYTTVAALPDVAAQPRYIIEAISVPEAGSIKKPQAGGNFNYFYRVTAVGFGANTSSRVMLQAVYRQY